MKSLKEFLDSEPMLDKAELARQMFPGRKQPRAILNNKLAEAPTNTGRKRITEKDQENANEVLKVLAGRITDYVAGHEGKIC